MQPEHPATADAPRREERRRGRTHGARDRPKGAGAGGGEGEETRARIQVFLGEFRLIGPGLAALLGFQLTVAFQQSFEAMGRPAQTLNFIGVSCTAAALLFLLVPASYHRFTRDMADTEEFLLFARGCVHLAFAFLPLGLSAAMALQALRSFQSEAVGAAVGVLSLGLFLAAWWVVPRQRARRVESNAA